MKGDEKLKILYTDGYSDITEDVFVVVEFKDHAEGNRKYGGVSLTATGFGETPTMSEYGLDFFSKWVDGLVPYEKDYQLEGALHAYLQEVDMDEEIED